MKALQPKNLQDFQTAMNAHTNTRHQCLIRNQGVSLLHAQLEPYSKELLVFGIKYDITHHILTSSKQNHPHVRGSYKCTREIHKRSEERRLFLWCGVLCHKLLNVKGRDKEETTIVCCVLSSLCCVRVHCFALWLFLNQNYVFGNCLQLLVHFKKLFAVWMLKPFGGTSWTLLP